MYAHPYVLIIININVIPKSIHVWLCIHHYYLRRKNHFGTQVYEVLLLFAFLIKNILSILLQFWCEKTITNKNRYSYTIICF